MFTCTYYFVSMCEWFLTSCGVSYTDLRNRVSTLWCITQKNDVWNDSWSCYLGYVDHRRRHGQFVALICPLFDFSHMSVMIRLYDFESDTDNLKVIFSHSSFCIFCCSILSEFWSWVVLTNLTPFDSRYVSCCISACLDIEVIQKSWLTCVPCVRLGDAAGGLDHAELRDDVVSLRESFSSSPSGYDKTFFMILRLHTLHLTLCLRSKTTSSISSVPFCSLSSIRGVRRLSAKSLSRVLRYQMTLSSGTSFSRAYGGAVRPRMTCVSCTWGVRTQLICDAQDSEYHDSLSTLLSTLLCDVSAWCGLLIHHGFRICGSEPDSCVNCLFVLHQSHQILLLGARESCECLFAAPGPRGYPALQRSGPSELPRAHRRYVHRSSTEHS